MAGGRRQRFLSFIPMASISSYRRLHEALNRDLILELSICRGRRGLHSYCDLCKFSSICSFPLNLFSYYSFPILYESRNQILCFYLVQDLQFLCICLYCNFIKLWLAHALYGYPLFESH